MKSSKPFVYSLAFLALGLFIGLMWSRTASAQQKTQRWKLIEASGDIGLAADVYLDPNTNNLIYLGQSGGIAVVSAK